MKNYIASLTQLSVAAAGGVAVSLAGSFGWYSRGNEAESVLGVHSVILLVAGGGLLAASVFIRQSSSRIAALEEQIALLQKKQG